MHERTARIAANEAVFRELNTQLEALSAGEDMLACVCECGELGCTEPLTVGRDDYLRVRADPTTFLVKPGHAKPEVEDVVGEGEGFEIVRKKDGLPAKLARDTAWAATTSSRQIRGKSPRGGLPRRHRT